MPLKRRAKSLTPGLRMSSNNARDVLTALQVLGVVERVAIPRRQHAHYQLTSAGKMMQQLLLQAYSPCP
jgi:DNA-binding HxlR family transcriptional regulator